MEYLNQQQADISNSDEDEEAVNYEDHFKH